MGTRVLVPRRGTPGEVCACTNELPQLPCGFLGRQGSTEDGEVARWRGGGLVGWWGDGAVEG